MKEPKEVSFIKWSLDYENMSPEELAMAYALAARELGWTKRNYWEDHSHPKCWMPKEILFSLVGIEQAEQMLDASFNTLKMMGI